MKNPKIRTQFSTTDGRQFLNETDAEVHQFFIDTVESKIIDTGSYVLFRDLTEREFDYVVDKYHILPIDKKVDKFFLEGRLTENLLVSPTHTTNGRYDLIRKYSPSDDDGTNLLVYKDLCAIRDAFTKICEVLR